MPEKANPPDFKCDPICALLLHQSNSQETKKHQSLKINAFCGDDETRTRDPRRDRPIF